MKFFFVKIPALLALFVLMSCGHGPSSNHSAVSHTDILDFNNPPSPTPATQQIEDKYPGVTIDQRFPIISEHSFGDKGTDKLKFDVSVLGLTIQVSGFAPKVLRRKSVKLLSFKTRQPPDYWSNLVGTSSLLGEASSEIYVVSTGPGAVCCTNYWVVDVSSKKPKLIFRSEDFGNFREPMEIFDHDDDGVFELVQ